MNCEDPTSKFGNVQLLPVQVDVLKTRLLASKERLSGKHD